MAVSRKIVLHFPERLADQAIVYRLAKDYDLKFNILKASVSPQEEGVLVMELSGEARNYDKGVQFLTRMGVKTESLSQDVVRNESRCTHCGACITLCPSGAFTLELPSRRVLFDNTKCIVCEFCIKACPPRAMELYF